MSAFAAAPALGLAAGQGGGGPDQAQIDQAHLLQVAEDWELVMLQDATPWGPLLLGVLLSGLAAYSCIHWFLKLVERVGMLPFVIYRILLAAVLLVIYL